MRDRHCNQFVAAPDPGRLGSSGFHNLGAFTHAIKPARLVYRSRPLGALAYTLACFLAGVAVEGAPPSCDDLQERDSAPAVISYSSDLLPSGSLSEA